MRDLTDDEMVESLIDAGWTREDAEKEVKRMLEDAAIENGMD
ncbi:unnamed protein product [marine sediment metagenome]|uniref:Uncharacterized protein n=1 Tax=marine sediment metagenome TaxID=412755 RepID=X1G5U3_9ZZZZ